MIRGFFAFFLVVFYLQVGVSAPSCKTLFTAPHFLDLLDDLNQKYAQSFYRTSVEANVRENSNLLTRHYKIFKLNRMVKSLNKNAQSMDAFELSQFVFKLDRLAFADAMSKSPESEAKLGSQERAVLSQARRQILSEGIIRYFDIPQNRTGFFKKFYYYFSQSTSWKYWRWSSAAFVMPKLVGLSLPPELAAKVLLEGFDRHKAEVEKHLPQIRNRDYFNKFSKIYNTTLLISLFTVVPYLVNDYYVEQMKIGEQQAAQMLEPLVKTSQDMAKIDFFEQKVEGTLAQYYESYLQKYGSEPTAEHMAEVEKVIREKYSLEMNN